jgi:hypothetical protein
MGWTSINVRAWLISEMTIPNLTAQHKLHIFEHLECMSHSHKLLNCHFIKYECQLGISI